MSDRAAPDGAPGLFVIGCARSGTTMVRVCLGAHGMICAAPEGSPLLAFRGLPDGRDYSGGPEGLLRLLEREPKIAKRWHADPAVLRAEWAKERPLDRAAAVSAVYRAHRDATKPGASIVCDKNPIHSIHGALLRRVFPRAKRLHLVRDPRAVLASVRAKLAAGRWLGFCQGAASTAVMWNESARWAEASRRDPLAFVVRYEDLVEKPEETFAAVCEWLGAPMDPGMLDPSRWYWADTNDGRTPPPGGSPLSRPVNAGRIDAWRDELAPGDAAAMEVALGRRMRTFGYAPDYQAHRGAGAKVLAREVLSNPRGQQVHVALAKALGVGR